MQRKRNTISVNFLLKVTLHGPTIDESLNLKPSEKQVVQYMMNLLAVSNLPVKVTANRRVDTYKIHLQPLTSLLIVRPDGVILSMSRFNLPLFCLEVHSYLYENTITKKCCQPNRSTPFITLLLYPDIHEVSGFVFPKLPEETVDGSIISNSMCVTQVKVLFILKSILTS